MLTRLEIDGFKSFENFAVDLMPCVAITGHNGVGKTNFLEVIKLLSMMARTGSITEAFSLMSGDPSDYFRQTPSARGSKMTLVAEILVDPFMRDANGQVINIKHTRLRYQISLHHSKDIDGKTNIYVMDESICPVKKEDDTWVAMINPSPSFRSGYLKYEHHLDEIYQRSGVSGNSDHVLRGFYALKDDSILESLKQEMRRWCWLRVDPFCIAAASSVANIPSDILEEDASNLSGVLSYLRNQGESEFFADVCNIMSAIMPRAHGLEKEKGSQGEPFLFATRDGLKHELKGLSGGAIRAIAMRTASQVNSLLCVDELETGIHPKAQEILVKHLQYPILHPEMYHSEDGILPLKQILFVTHSPVLLSNALERLDNEGSHIEDVLITEMASVVDSDMQEIRLRTRMASSAARYRY